MHISNVRLGFATNSSSTHSMVLLPNPAPELDNVDKPSFGWGFFTATKAQSKKMYLQASLYNNFKQVFGVNIAKVLAKEFCPTVSRNIQGVEHDLGAYVDHQSLLTFPVSFGRRDRSPEIDMNFYRAFETFILSNPNLAILGGNDNDEEEHELSSYPSYPNLLPIEGVSKDWVVRHDKTYDFWTLFCRANGTKTRISFHDKPIVKAALPELVDIKITDWCDVGCQFCYQSSTTQGKYGDLTWIKRILMSLSTAKVFEVALGGGETTSHPDFVEILSEARKLGIVPNFTTRKLSWLKERWAPKALELCGAFAYSVTTSAAVENLIRECQLYKVSLNKVSIQIPMGTLSKKEFEAILEVAFEASLNVTVLGFKSVGFGSNFKTVDYSWLPTSITDCVAKYSFNSWQKLGIDSAIAAEFENEFESLGIPRAFYYTSEGTFSCYIDAVNLTVAPSSYCDMLAGVSLTECGFEVWNARWLEDTFVNFS
jgi:hypothetical protein